MSLSRFLARTTLSIVFLSISIAFILTFIFQYKYFNDDLEIIKKEFINLKKKEIKREVQRVYDYIKYQDKNNQNLSLEKLQNDTLNWISTIRFEKEGYIFVNDLKGNALVFDGRKLTNPIKHPNQEVYKQLLDSVKDKNEDFIFYKFKKINTNEAVEKLSFIKLYENYGWIIGGGLYLEDLDHEIKRKSNDFYNKIIEQLSFLIIIFMIMLAIFYLISNKISDYINQNISNLLQSFRKASSENEKIETKDLTFNEFISLGNSLNKILEDKNLTEKKLQDYLKIVDENIIFSRTNPDGIITYVSKAFCDISRYSKEELLGKTHKLLRHPDFSDKFYDEIWKILKQGLIWKGEIKNIAKDGSEYWVDAIIQPVFENNQIVSYTALRQNITDKKKIEFLSQTDELTQLYNRRKFNFVIENELNRKKRENALICFMILDVDYFKSYNDTYGHQNGDIALAKISSILKDNTKRVGDYAFRLGGEEFAIFLNTDNQEKAYEHAFAIKNQIENLKINHKENKINPYITISIGVVCKKALDIKDSTELYKLADDALYKAKGNGRNCVYIYI